MSSEFALFVGVTWGGGWANALKIRFIPKNNFFSAYWFEVEIHMVNLARPPPNVVNQITPMVLSIKTYIRREPF